MSRTKSSNTHQQFLGIILFLFTMSSVAYAQCGKDDIEFYLEKGFTQEQITQLCSGGSGVADSESIPNYTPYQQKVIIYQQGSGPEIDKDGFTQEERKAISDLEAGGDVTNLEITSEAISYTRKVCISVAKGSEYNDRFKACPEADFSIPRNNVEVSHSGKKLIILGGATVQVEGNIDVKLKKGFDYYPIEFRRDLERKFNWQENGELTDFPVRGDYSVTRIVNAFRTLNSTYKENSEANVEKVAESKPSESVSEINPEEVKEKKKKWWNPFD
jgi:hypothetical protein